MKSPVIESRQAFDDVLNNALSDLGVASVNVAWPNILFTPDTEQTYLTPYILRSPTRAASLGTDGFERMSGIYQISVNSPRAKGMSEPERIASALVELFRGGTVINWCGYRFVSETAYANTHFYEADRVTVPVTVQWYAYSPKG